MSVVDSMPKRRREDEQEDTLETGNVDNGDFSEGDSEDDDEDGETEKYVMKEEDMEGKYFILFYC